MVHQVTDTFNHHTTVIFTAVLRRVAFLLKLFQRGGVLLFGTRLIKLRLQEVHHLIETDIPATNRRQQLVDIIEVVTRQQMFFCFFQADPQMFQLVVKDLPPSQNVFVTVLFTEPGVNFRTPTAGCDVTEVWV